ncbi:adenylate isopentenyltransferase 5, chloroplastic [Jatropha curcas]|nr:adenylate isopentenyltransferase 5, chloroplastic [Jatropha curcas]
MGATCTGKSKLSVDIATHFQAEIINSDKMQFYKGLDIVTNKLAESERNGIPHHLLGFVEDPEADFTAQDFSNHVNSTITQIINNGSLPIIVGGSNNYIKQLVESPSSNFKEKFDSCFIWLDVAVPVLYEHAAKRVDLMVQSGLVEEVRSMVEPGSDYSRGVWRAIGVPEMDQFLYAEKYNADERMKKIFLDLAIDRIKENTCRLVDSQLRKIHDMIYELGWELHRIDATSVREKDGEEAVEAWNKEVLEPSLEIVRDFLQG